jgi:hypothetical protein
MTHRASGHVPGEASAVWRAEQQIVRCEGDLPAGLMIRHPRSAAASPGSRDIRGTRSHAQGREPGQLRRPGQADGPRHIEVNWLHRDALSLPTCGTEPSDLLEWPAGRQSSGGRTPTLEVRAGQRGRSPGPGLGQAPHATWRPIFRYMPPTFWRISLVPICHKSAARIRT